MIIKTIDFKEFCDTFDQFNDGYKNKFSFEGKRALFDYLDNLSDELGESINLDVIALCCDYTEYESLKEVQKNYTDIKDLEDLKNHTQVIEFPTGNGLIIQNF